MTGGGDVDVSIVIPLHDEEAALPLLLAALTRNFDRGAMTYEALLVDDASTDGTRAVIRDVCARDPRFRPVLLDVRGGQTGCYQAAFPLCRGGTIVRMDGDMQDDPDDLPLFEAKIKQGYDIIVGLREARRHHLAYRIASRAFDLLALLLYQSPFHENSVSFAAFAARLVKDVPLRPGDHRFLIPIALSRGPVKVGEVIVRHGDRVGGQSKYRMLNKFARGGADLVGVVVRIRRGHYRDSSP